VYEQPNRHVPRPLRLQSTLLLPLLLTQTTSFMQRRARLHCHAVPYIVQPRTGWPYCVLSHSSLRLLLSLKQGKCLSGTVWLPVRHTRRLCVSTCSLGTLFTDNPQTSFRAVCACCLSVYVRVCANVSSYPFLCTLFCVGASAETMDLTRAKIGRQRSHLLS
jgi:hypothetical protein